jgi:hypothetical protein
MEAEHNGRDMRDHLRAYQEFHDGDNNPLPHEYRAGHTQEHGAEYAPRRPFKMPGRDRRPPHSRDSY